MVCPPLIGDLVERLTVGRSDLESPVELVVAPDEPGRELEADHSDIVLPASALADRPSARKALDPYLRSRHDDHELRAGTPAPHVEQQLGVHSFLRRPIAPCLPCILSLGEE